MVEGSTERENVAVGTAAVLTPVAPAAGKEVVTVNGTGDWVVKDHVTVDARAVPSSALTAVVSLAVYVVL
jgi:hypothetical protein